MALRRLCDEHGILLIADEVQSGFARTGKMFGIEHSGVEPDLIAIAKSLAGGLPLSGVIGKAAVMDAAEPGGLGGTYGGNPVACAAALAVLDVIEQEKLLQRADAVGARIKAKLEKMSRSNNLMPMAAIRGPGAMVGFEIVKERGGFVPDPEATKLLTERALGPGAGRALLRRLRQCHPHPGAADRRRCGDRRGHGPAGAGDEGGGLERDGRLRPSGGREPALPLDPSSLSAGHNRS